MAASAPKPLTDAERERVAETIVQVRALVPGLVPLVKDLHALGMFDGWRAINYVGPIRPDPPNCVHAGQMVLESAEALKERMKHGSTTR